jgi:hypothetical protein
LQTFEIVEIGAAFGTITMFALAGLMFRVQRGMAH